MKKILFIQKQFFVYFGITSIAGYLKEKLPEIETGLLISDAEKNLYRKIKEFDPDVIAISALSTEHKWLGQLLNNLKHGKAKILLGGLHATLYPEICLNEFKNIDYLCMGDGEYFIVEFIKRFNSNNFYQLPGLAYRVGGEIRINNIEKLFELSDSSEDRELYYKRYPSLSGANSKSFIAGRGCKFMCSYCYNMSYNSLVKSMLGNDCELLRKKPVGVLIKEIEYCIKNYPAKTICFAEDNFVTDKNWIIEFCKSYKEKICLPFRATGNPNYLDEEIIKIIKDAGCHSFSIGVENSGEQLRKEVFKRPGNISRITEIIKLLHRYGILVTTTNMHLYPGATYDGFFENLYYNIENKVDIPYATVYMPFPGTEMEKTALEKGALKKKVEFNELPSTYYYESLLDIPGKERLLRLHKLFYFLVKFSFFIPILKLFSYIKLPFVYDWLFTAGLAFNYMKERKIGIIDLLKLFWRSRKSV